MRGCGRAGGGGSFCLPCGSNPPRNQRGLHRAVPQVPLAPLRVLALCIGADGGFPGSRSCFVSPAAIACSARNEMKRSPLECLALLEASWCGQQPLPWANGGRGVSVVTALWGVSPVHRAPPPPPHTHTHAPSLRHARSHVQGLSERETQLLCRLDALTESHGRRGENAAPFERIVFPKAVTWCAD
jgi:hypothetical protein